MKYRLMLIKIGIKKGLASKYALIFWLFSSLISLTVQYFLWQAVLTGKPNGEFKQTISYLVLMQLLTVLFPKTSYDVNDKVRSGDIALDLLKPVAFATQLLWESIGYSVVKFAVIGTVDLLVCLWILNFQIAVSTILMVLVTTTLAYLLYFELELLLGTFSFYTYSIWGISTFKEA
ncbi:MAG: ABC-2 family transporter protein, partial [Lactobacillus sp.]|nr:ABC-2 family transporter protein [Lactobacillus sp.]